MANLTFDITFIFNYALKVVTNEDSKHYSLDNARKLFAGSNWLIFESLYNDLYNLYVETQNYKKMLQMRLIKDTRRMTMSFYYTTLKQIRKLYFKLHNQAYLDMKKGITKNRSYLSATEYKHTFNPKLTTTVATQIIRQKDKPVGESKVVVSLFNDYVEKQIKFKVSEFNDRAYASTVLNFLNESNKAVEKENDELAAAYYVAIEFMLI